MSGTIAQLKELKELLDGGVLTQGEFDAQKSVILAGQGQSTMSGKPTGPRFDSSTGQPIPKFDPKTGKQNWWDEEGGQQLGLPPPPQPAIMMQPGMIQPVAGINAAGQMVDASGNIVVMDGGGRVWSAPYSKIMANEVDGCYCSWGLIPVWAATTITSQAFTKLNILSCTSCWSARLVCWICAVLRYAQKKNALVLLPC